MRLLRDEGVGVKLRLTRLVKVVDEMRATPPLLKRLNERTVLDAIRAEAPISRAEISRRAGISKPTVSLALQSLLDAGLVRETEAAPGRPSYGAVYFEPVPEAALVLGFDLGARFLRGALSDLAGAVRARQDVELAGADAAGAAGRSTRSARLARRGVRARRGLVDGVVVGVPGVVEADGRPCGWPRTCPASRAGRSAASWRRGSGCR